MRLLVVSNYYPPHHIGGYELGCRDIVERLRRAGHEITVLTSQEGVPRPTRTDYVWRWLTSDLRRRVPMIGISEAIRAAADELWNQWVFRIICRRCRPDVVYVWNPVGISLSAIGNAYRSNIPVAYLVSDHWLTTWQKQPGYRFWSHQSQPRYMRPLWSAARLFFKAIGLSYWEPRFTHVHFVSQFLKDEALSSGIAVRDAAVFHWGVDPEVFPFQPLTAPGRVLCCGQLEPWKGFHTVVQALSLLGPAHRNVTLTIAGSGSTTYVNELRQLARDGGIEDRIHFIGRVDRGALRDIYHQHDIFVFPSVWDEPFSIALLEAMSTGRAVVATVTGGTPEIVRHDWNGLTFEKENAVDCATQLRRLLEQPTLANAIGARARATIEGAFTLHRMAQRIELDLIRIHEDA